MEGLFKKTKPKHPPQNHTSRLCKELPSRPCAVSSHGTHRHSQTLRGQGKAEVRIPPEPCGPRPPRQPHQSEGAQTNPGNSAANGGAGRGSRESRECRCQRCPGTPAGLTCKAPMAALWKRRSVLKSWAISRTRRWKGSLRIKSSVDFW